jgi:ABC-type nitrate/sulfonate/bicarbonate transport system substrate-binding protein
MIQQRSMAAIVGLEGGQIKDRDPKSLMKANGEKTRILDQPGSTNQVTFPLYAQQAGVDTSKVEFVPSPPPALAGLLAAGELKVGDLPGLDRDEQLALARRLVAEAVALVPEAVAIVPEAVARPPR